MHLRSVTLKGFKSFPDRTRLEFGPGVSVIVGPNGSGKSNVTDAVLWAMGEQSPLAVRGRSMQDVIFGGGHGVPARSSAEVEVVIDNSDGELASEFSELSIVRRLDRSGEGEYRLNGARCRLVDVLETLSDTGLGKEMHSVVSQGRVEAIVSSKPLDRRMLIEEAAGLGKHRKRRRRAQLKLDRTQQNLDRALDVEREARARLRPLRRQAEAAELHARLERQSDEAALELTREDARVAEATLADALTTAAAARALREQAQQQLEAVSAGRERAERALTERSERHDALAGRCFAARSAGERLGLRLETVRAATETLRSGAARRAVELEALARDTAAQAPGEGSQARLAQLETELGGLDALTEAALEQQLAELERDRVAASEARAASEQALAARRTELRATEQQLEQMREACSVADRTAQAARAQAAQVGAELAASNQFLRMRAGAPGGGASLADEVGIEAGYELALSAALGGRLSAALAGDRAAGAALLESAGTEGGSALIARAGERATLLGQPPSPGAQRLLERVTAPEAIRDLVEVLLADVWIVARVDEVADDFRGVAVTVAGRAWMGAWGELRQVPAGGTDRLLAERNRRHELIERSEAAARGEHGAITAADAERERLAAAEAAREEHVGRLRVAQREADEAAEAERRVGWLIERRREAPDEGPEAVRRAELRAELAAERRAAERVERERSERGLRVQHLRTRLERARLLGPAAERLAAAIESALETVAARSAGFEAELAADRQAGERLAGELRALAQEEAGVQARLRAAAEAVTGTEVGAQRARDRCDETGAVLERLAAKLGLAPEPSAEPLPAEERAALEGRIERLARRREQLGPVNPLAQAEYEEALAHVEELEGQRGDLERALRELRALIRDTDRRIHEAFEETFGAAAKNFEEVVAHLFPGGRGRLRLVAEDAGPRPVIGGQPADGEQGAEEGEDEGEDRDGDEQLLGVEIEITPAGKSMKRLSLLSGGEKSLTAMAFLFAVFLARPCPFYILDEVEAALDDANIDRFLGLVRSFSDRAQFIVVTHQQRTMEAADWLYGVSMAGDGVSKVVSRRLPREDAEPRRALGAA